MNEARIDIADLHNSSSFSQNRSAEVLVNLDHDLRPGPLLWVQRYQGKLELQFGGFQNQIIDNYLCIKISSLYLGGLTANTVAPKHFSQADEKT
jgi:hypothetical protein